MARLEAMEFTSLPPIMQDEFDFALDDTPLAGFASEGWDKDAPRMTFTDDGTGYAVRPCVILRGHPHTYRVEVSGETYVWVYSAEQWCIVGEDL